MDIILLPVALTIIKILWHFNLDSLGPQGNHLVDIFSRNSALKVTDSSQIFHTPRVYFPNDNLEKLAREARQLASEKEKQDWKINNFCFDKKIKLWFG